MLGNLKREIIKMEDETGRDVQSRRMFNSLLLRGGGDEDGVFQVGLFYRTDYTRPKYFEIMERTYGTVTVREAGRNSLYVHKVMRDEVSGHETIKTSINQTRSKYAEKMHAIDGGVTSVPDSYWEPTYVENVVPESVRFSPRATMKKLKEIQRKADAGRDTGVTFIHWYGGPLTFDINKNKRVRSRPNVVFPQPVNFDPSDPTDVSRRWQLANSGEIMIVPNDVAHQWSQPRVYQSHLEVIIGDLCLYMNLLPCKVMGLVGTHGLSTRQVDVQFTDVAYEMVKEPEFSMFAATLPESAYYYEARFEDLVPVLLVSLAPEYTPARVSSSMPAPVAPEPAVPVVPAVPVEPRVSSSMPAPVVNVAPEPVVPIAPVAPETVVPVVPDAPEPVVPLEPVVPVAPEPVVPLEPVVPVAPEPVVERPVAQQISIDALNELAIKFASDETSLGCLKAVLDIDKRAADAIDRHGVTPLSVAKNGAVLQVLLDYGVDINRKFPTNHSLLGLGHTLLHIYAENYYHNSKSVGYLDSIPRDKIKHVIDDKFNEREGDGTYYYRDLSIKQLIQLGANVNATNDNGDTPLHLASKSRRSYNYISTRYGNSWTGTHLIQNGAELNVQNAFGETPLHLAASQGRSNAAFELIKAGARIDVKDNMQRTPLHWASERGARTQMKYLLNKAKEMGIIDEYVSMKDEDGMTALDIGSSRTMEWVMRV